MLAKLIRRGLILASALVLFTSAAPVFANSAQHYAEWFILADEREPAPGLVGAQLLVCDKDNCDAPRAALAYGACTAPQCVSTDLSKPQVSGFGCDARKCYYWTYQIVPIRLVVQFADGAAVSEPLPPPTGGTGIYRVTRAGEHLTLTPTQANVPSGFWSRVSRWLPSFLLTEVIELAVAFVFFKFLFRLSGALLKPTLILVAVVNLVTHPIVFFVFPGFMQWYEQAEAGIALSVILLAAILTAALFIVRYLRGRARTVLGVVSGVLLVIAVPIALLLMFGGAYGAGGSYRVSGWSVEQTLLFAETFAVVAEAVLLWLLMRRQIPFWQMAATSLAMNLASFGMGVLLAPMI